MAQSYQRENSLENKHLYQGKELITDLGLEQYDFGPRQYDPWAPHTTTIDPLADQFSSWSPYSWVFGNPVRFTDPTGMAPSDVVLGGLQKEKTLEQINSGLKGITVAMDDKGKLSYTRTEGQELNESATRLTGAIDDHSVEVTINTTMKAENSKGGVLIGGAFMGNEVAADGTVKATNEYDTPTGGRVDAAYNKPGGTVLHEITEAYEGAKMSQKSGQSSGPDGTSGSVYKAAHKAALKQPGSITETYYDNKGNVLPAGTPLNQVHGAVWRAKGNVVHSIIRK